MPIADNLTGSLSEPDKEGKVYCSSPPKAYNKDSRNLGAKEVNEHSRI